MYLVVDALLWLLLWGYLLVYCKLCWLVLTFFLLHSTATCPSPWQEKQLISFLGEKNLLWDLMNLFNSSLGGNDLFVKFISCDSFFGYCCFFLVLFASFLFTLLVPSSSVLFRVASLSYMDDFELLFSSSQSFMNVISSSSSYKTSFHLTLF